jgi:hypothetical protein
MPPRCTGSRCRTPPRDRHRPPRLRRRHPRLPHRGPARSGVDRRRRRRRGARPQRSAPGSWASARATSCASTATSRARRAAWSASSRRRTRRRASSWRRPATGTSSASTSTSRRGCRSVRHAARTRRSTTTGWFTLVLEDCAPMEPGDQLRGCTLEQVDAAARELAGLHAPLWDAPELDTHACFADRGSVEPELLVAGLRAVVPASSIATAPPSRPTRSRSTSGSASRPGAGSRRGRPRARSCTATTDPTTSSSRPDASAPEVAVVDWQGFSRGARCRTCRS